MTVLSNRLDNSCGVGTSGVLDWTFGTVGDVREWGRELDQKQKDFFGPMVDSGGQFLGGVEGMTEEQIDKIDAAPLVDKEAWKKVNDEVMGDNMWSNAFNAGVDTLPGTVGETPWQEVVVGGGLETMGDYAKDLVETFGNAVGRELAQGLQDRFNNSTPDYVYGKFNAGRRSGLWFAEGVIGIRTPQVTLYEEAFACVDGELFVETFGGWFEGEGIDGGQRGGLRLNAGPKDGGGGVYVDVSQEFEGDGSWTTGAGWGIPF